MVYSLALRSSLLASAPIYSAGNMRELPGGESHHGIPVGGRGVGGVSPNQPLWRGSLESPHSVHTQGYNDPNTHTHTHTQDIHRK